MEKLAKNKPVFIGLTCLSVGCLVSAFGYPLQKLEVYSQPEIGAFNQTYEKAFVITESDTNYPYGFDEQRAVKIAHVYNSYAPQKIMLLILAGFTAGYALLIGDKTVINAEIDNEIGAIQATGKKQLLLERVKHNLALASKAQRISFMDEMKALLDEFGTPENEIIEADELNALYDEVSDKESENSSESSLINLEAIREVFPENIDRATWNAVTKAMANGASREEVLIEVLQSNNDVGKSYLDFLKQKYL
jgi:hypothetical protein